MVDIMKLQATIGRGGRDEKITYSAGIICEVIRMAKHINIQSASLDLQAKGGMEKIKYRAL